MNDSPAGKMTDDELMDRLKHLAALWFKNADILVLEELYRRYNRAKADHQIPRRTD